MGLAPSARVLVSVFDDRKDSRKRYSMADCRYDGDSEWKSKFRCYSRFISRWALNARPDDFTCLRRRL